MLELLFPGSIVIQTNIFLRDRFPHPVITYVYFDWRIQTPCRKVAYVAPSQIVYN